jgi:hypothetical protein
MRLAKGIGFLVALILGSISLQAGVVPASGTGWRTSPSAPS